MNVIRYTSEYAERWNAFLANAKNTTFLFHRNFMDYHADRFRDHSFVVLNEKNNIVALMPANITSDGIVISHQGLTYGGLVVPLDEKLRDMALFLREILKSLHDEGITTLVYKEIPSFYNDFPTDEMQYLLYVLNARLVRRDAGAVIRNPLRFPFQRNRVSMIKRARELGVAVRCDDDFASFWENILVPNLATRHDARPVHSLAEIMLLHDRFPDKIRQYNAWHEGEIMAGATVFEIPNVARVQYTSGCETGRKNGSLDYLFNALINEFYKDRTYIDLGNSNEVGGEGLNVGLLSWKEGLGARTYAQNFYEIDTRRFALLDGYVRD